MEWPKQVLLPLASFFDRLKQAGITISPAQHVKIQYLLEDNCFSLHPSKLGLLIAPVISSSKSEQELIYKVYRQFYVYDVEPLLKFKKFQIDPGKPNYGYHTFINAVLLVKKNLRLVLIFFVLLFLVWAVIPPKKPNTFFNLENQCIEVGKPIQIKNLTESILLDSSDSRFFFQWQIEDSITDIVNPIHTFYTEGYKKVKLKVINKKLWHSIDSTYALEVFVNKKGINTDFNFTFEPSNPSPGDSIQVSANPNFDKDYKYQWIIGKDTLFGSSQIYRVGEVDSILISLSVFKPEQEDNTNCHAKSEELIKIERESPINNTENINPLDVEEPSPLVNWIELIWPTLLLLLIKGLGSSYKYFRQRKIQEEYSNKFQIGKHPPYSIPIPSQEHLVTIGTDLYDLAKIFRKRIVGDSKSINVEASVKATIEKGGYPKLVNNKNSSITEYLVLIDRKYEQDHQARVIHMIMNILKNEEVELEIFYFEGNPRLCFQEREPFLDYFPVTIEQLAILYPKHRLMIFADLGNLIIPPKAQFQDWVEHIFGTWEERFWLPSYLPPEWGYEEYIIHQSFMLLSREVNALQMVELLNGERRLEYGKLQAKLNLSKKYIPLDYDLRTIAGLKKFLEPSEFQWIAATAIYFEPNWEVTILIGHAIAKEVIPGSICWGLTIEYDILEKISHIPWLRDGDLGDALRKELIENLDQEVEIITRKAILNVLSKINIPTEAYAYQEKETQITLHNAHLFPHDSNYKNKLTYLRSKGLINEIDEANLSKFSKFKLSKAIGIIGIIFLIIIQGFVIFPRIIDFNSELLYLSDKANIYITDIDAFELKVREISQLLDIPPEWLMAVMYSESKFDAQALNQRGSGATGLIQFMPAAVSEMGISLQRLGRMTHSQQLEYVYIYLQKVRERYGDYDSLTDLYLAVLYPKARKQDYCYTLYAKPSMAYNQNSDLDENKDGRVTISDIDRHMKRLYPTAYIKKNIQEFPNWIDLLDLFGENEEKPVNIEENILDESRLYLMDKTSLYIQDEASFERKVREISDMLGVRAEWLMAVMYSESKFDAQAFNQRGSGATGLIQFMPGDASDMGISLQRLGRMTHSQQLEYVYIYLQKVRERYGDYDSLTDLYLAVLYPKARKQDYCYTLYAKPSKAYNQNRGLDENKDGRVTISDIDRRMERLYPTAYFLE